MNAHSPKSQEEQMSDMHGLKTEHKNRNERLLNECAAEEAKRECE